MSLTFQSKVLCEIQGEVLRSIRKLAAKSYLHSYEDNITTKALWSLMHRWRKLQNIYLNVKILQCDVSSQETHKNTFFFQLSDWCWLFWESDRLNYGNLLYCYKKNWRESKILVCFSFDSHVWAWNVIVRRECLAFFTGSGRNYFRFYNPIDFRLSLLSTRFDL